ncbi:hypothetical protein B0H11DRAFT_2107213 [Mycena galericulata]|nr:hypothetical protein B0H11DRAFT_2107213 [Mycena galericulata]
MRRYGNRLQFLGHIEPANIPAIVLCFYRLHSHHKPSSMIRPRALDLPAHGSSNSMPKKNIRSPRVLPSPLIRRGTWHQQQYFVRFISRKITHGTNKSKLVIHALRRRLLRRGLNSPRTPRKTFTPSDITRPGREGNSPILLPQLPPLALPCLFPEMDGCSSDTSRSSSSSPESEISRRPTRRYILPDSSDPLAGFSPELVSTIDIKIRISGQSVSSPSLPPLRFEPFNL